MLMSLGRAADGCPAPGPGGAGVTPGREALVRQFSTPRMKRSPRAAAGKPVKSGAGISGSNARGRTLRSTYHAWQTPLSKRVLAIEVIRSAQLQLTRMADPLGAPSRHGYLPAHSHVAMIGVAGSRENSDKMTRTIYNALANRGYIMTRLTHHYSHNVQADASGASRHSGAGYDLALRHIAAIDAETMLSAASFRMHSRWQGFGARTIAQCLCRIFLHVLMHLHLL